MITAFLIFVGLIPVLYLIFSVYPAILIHSLDDSRAPETTKDFVKMTYLPYLFKRKKMNKPY